MSKEIISTNVDPEQLRARVAELEAENAYLRDQCKNWAEAYEKLMKENSTQAADLETWNMVTGWMLLDKAEGRVVA